MCSRHAFSLPSCDHVCCASQSPHQTHTHTRAHAAHPPQVLQVCWDGKAVHLCSLMAGGPQVLVGALADRLLLANRCCAGFIGLLLERRLGLSRCARR